LLSSSLPTLSLIVQDCVVLQAGLSWLGGSAAVSSLAVMYAMGMTETFNWLIRVTTQAEAEMSRVERVLHYSQLPSEAPLFPSTASQDGLHKASDDAEAVKRGLIDTPVVWPNSGTVEFREVVMRYRSNLDPVLKGVSFTARGGEKIGIVGRTGAGKSSIMLCLFRIEEIESGSIVVDGVDIGTLGLRRLRRAISIIPQNPVLFSGTFRSNLIPDTDGENDEAPISDERLWRVLGQVGLREYVEGQSLGLDAPIDEKGQNLSAGQRQLVCLARALLRDSRVLVMDEATASCDPETDNLIQRTVRQEFRGVTILTIAHRLPTIIDYDKVLVMGGGRVLEYDTPSALLSRSGGAFSDMVDSTGPESSTFLRRAAGV
jgi:ATP-binding cassette, subfamily C (CFTR/MRP), member 1